MSRRTQAQRRADTQHRLLTATVGCLSELGYAKTSVKAVCTQAGVSQGALFNYFPTRLDLIVAATEHICEVQRMRFADGDLQLDLEMLIHRIRALARSAEHAAWHEVMVAARSDHALRLRVRPSLSRFEAALLETAGHSFGLDVAKPDVAAMVLSVLHIFDSEAVTVAVLENPKIEAARVRWLTGLLGRAGQSAANEQRVSRAEQF